MHESVQFSEIAQNRAIKEVMDPIHINDDNKYYFWDEVWSCEHGPFETREEAEQALQDYVEAL